MRSPDRSPRRNWRSPVRPARVSSVVQSPRFGDDWWQRGVVYQIYPRSFADSDGDGVGDLPGIIDHLDHLGPDGLGVDAIWLSPIYPSPGLDLGYDVSDHAQRRSALRHRGRLRPARRGGARARHPGRPRPGHEPHQRSSTRGSPRRARRGPGRTPTGTCGATLPGTAPDGAPLPPNNWVSFFGGPGWQWEPRARQFYFHTFLVEQPELNWRAPGVEAAQFAMVRGWLERGVDGFRLDVFNVFLKHPELRSNPIREGSVGVGSPGPPVRPRPARLPGAHRPVPGDPRRATRPDVRRRAVRRHGRDGRRAARPIATSCSTGSWSRRPWTAGACAPRSPGARRAFGPDRWPTVVLSNHDQPRHATRLAAVGRARPTSTPIARAAAVLLLTLRGTPFLYYGEELGLGDVDVPRDRERRSARRPGRARLPAGGTARAAGRRCPGRAGPGAGLHHRPAVAPPRSRRGDPQRGRAGRPTRLDAVGSIAGSSRSGRRSPALQVGTLELDPAADGDVVAYAREAAGQRLLVAAQLGGAAGRLAPRRTAPAATAGGSCSRPLPARMPTPSWTPVRSSRSASTRPSSSSDRADQPERAPLLP